VYGDVRVPYFQWRGYKWEFKWWRTQIIKPSAIKHG